jgi:hypothetical protein
VLFGVDGTDSVCQYKEFQFGDIVVRVSPVQLSERYRPLAQANLLGASIGLEISRRLEYNYRKRREVDALILPGWLTLTCRLQIKRLYQPLGAEQPSDDEDDDEGGPVLPQHYVPATGGAPKRNTLNNVWDDREEVFDVGGESDDEGAARM